MFKFIHAADIHLDSSLRGLSQYEGAPVEAIRQAARRALENLVQLAIDEEVGFVLIAGDLYDGDWKDYRTGLYFVAQMTRLREAKIPVYLITGNHDAANKMTKALRLPETVRMLSSKKPETVHLADYNVAIHGQGFATMSVMDDLSEAYPPADSSCLNIGLLHTSATGREGHERYAPCTIEGLRAKRYDYWALGHVHKREILHEEDPLIVFPGNIQGRHIRECGPKGCMLVTVDDRNQPKVQMRPLDVLRWETCKVAPCEAQNGDDMVQCFAAQLSSMVEACDDRFLALRVEISGPCPAHKKIAAAQQHWTNEIRSAAIQLGSGNIWIEKVKIQTLLPQLSDQTELREGPLGELIQFVEELCVDEARLEKLGEELADLKKKLPAELKEGPEKLDLDSPAAMRHFLDNVKDLLIDRLLAPRAG